MQKPTGLNVVMGVTGGIAAYKACEVVSRLQKAGLSVSVIMTENACKFVAPLTFETLSKQPVAVGTFDRAKTWEVEHIALAKRADLFLIAPATANIIAKMAHGIADDMLSTTVLATKAPVLIAPAMNTGMWENPATQDNVRTLAARGVKFVGPEGGVLACGDSGMGRMSEPCQIVSACEELLNNKRDMCGLHVLVTAGPTREKIDPVRYMSNRSSGKMGYAIAEKAARRGAAVTLISGPTALRPPSGAAVTAIESTQELYDAVLAAQEMQDIIIQAAAPADFKAARPAAGKLKKQGGDGLTLALTQTPDIAQAVGERKRAGQTVVAFAAETDNVLENARRKLQKKNADLIVANDVSREGAGFDVDTNIVTLITKTDEESLPLLTKQATADAILDRVMRLRNA